MKKELGRQHSRTIHAVKDALVGTHAFLLACLVALIFLYSFLETGGLQRSFFNLVFFGLLFYVLKKDTAGDERSFRIALLLGIPALLLNLLFIWQVNFLFEVASLVLGIAFNAFCALTIVSHAVGGREVTRDKIFAAICAYLLIGISYGFVYVAIERINPGSFAQSSNHAGTALSQTDLLFYSFTTISTLGLGDISPLSTYARSVTVLEAITGVFYIAVMISRLVGLYAGTAKEK